MLDYIKDHVNEWLARTKLPVHENAFVLNPQGATPNFQAYGVQLPNLAGNQLRIVGEVYSLVNVGYNATSEQLDAAAEATTRRLMIAMRDQAISWLEANPEKT